MARRSAVSLMGSMPSAAGLTKVHINRFMFVFTNNVFYIHALTYVCRVFFLIKKCFFLDFEKKIDSKMWHFKIQLIVQVI